MKIVRTEDQLIVELGKREQRLLLELLGRYPCIPPAHHDHHRRSAHLPESSRRLLDEALAHQRAATKKQVLEWLSNPRRFEPTDTGSRLVLSLAEVEWLLQVLNDVRVGSWIQLGAPETRIEDALASEKTAPDFLAMELAGHFAMQLLEALE